MPATRRPLANLARTLDELQSRLERATVLDPVADEVAGWSDRLLPRGVTRDVASGVPIAHPLHPLLVAVPIGSWTAASWLDLTGGDRKAARRLVGLGILGALPAVVTGVNDWLTTSGGERRVGITHALVNDVALTLYGASWLARRRGRQVKGTLLALSGFAVTAVGGWLGGGITYALGVGVDTTVFQKFPTDWTDVAAEADVRAGTVAKGDADGVPVLLVRDGDRIVALADRCTHRGGPLHEGELGADCITCPWHGSRFAFDGSVLAGPATRPQPSLEVRVVAGRVEIRRPDEPRALRTNPVGR